MKQAVQTVIGRREFPEPPHHPTPVVCKACDREHTLYVGNWRWWVDKEAEAWVPSELCPACQAKKDRELTLQLKQRSYDAVNQKINSIIMDVGLSHKAIKTFKTWDWHEGTVACRQALRAFAKAKDHWLCISGAVGSGKTHLLEAYASYCHQNLSPVIFLSETELPSKVRWRERELDHLFEALYFVPVVVWDELGLALHEGAEEYERLYQFLLRVLDERLQDGRQLLFATNYSPTALRSRLSSDRLWDRLERGKTEFVALSLKEKAR